MLKQVQHDRKNIMRGNFFYKRLGRRLIGQRKRKELSQEQLAMLSTVDRTYLARIEEGKANPSVKVLNKIAKVLKVRLSDLLKGV
jgi:transcriptional regulator with XRE-family HTH domain